MSWTLASIVVLGVLAALGGAGMLLIAVLCPAHRLLRRPKLGDMKGVGGMTAGGCCPGCGYSTDGLECNRCPECGSLFAAAAILAARRRRRSLCGLGIALTALALSCVPLSDAMRYGVAHAMPSIVLVEAMRYVPSWHGAVARELQGRADAGQLGSWTSAALAGACADILRSQTDPPTRRDAAWLLSRVAKHAADGTVRAMVEDPDAAVRALGVEAIRLSGSPRAGTSDRLNALALDDASALVRKRAIDAMRYRAMVGGGADGDDRTRSTMLLALDDPSDGVRQRAVIGLGESSSVGDESVRAIGARTKDPSEDVRWVAAVTLGRMAQHRDDAADALAGSLNDASPMVRASAAIALGEAGGARGGEARRAWVLPRLLDVALGDEDEMVRGAALGAIRAMRG